MSRIASRLNELGLTLPPPMQAPGGIKLPFPWINVRGDRAIVSGHGRQNPDVSRHARSAIGVAGLPFNIAVEIEGEVLLRP